MAMTILKKNKMGACRVLDIKLDYTATLIETVALMQRQKHRNQLNRVQKQIHTYNHLINNKTAIVM